MSEVAAPPPAETIKPNTAKPPFELHYSSAVALPEGLLQQCSAKARAVGRKLESWIEDRLTRCLNHDAQRPLYFNDTSRERLEQLLGGVLLRDADDALRLLTSRFTLAVGDEKGIQIEEGVYTVLKERASDLGLSLPDLIREAVANGLSDAAYGAH